MGKWNAPSLPFEIEIELDVLEEIRHRAEEGFQRIGHGGVEFGGVLYGLNEGGLVRILEWRELESDHSLGPSFVLSAADRKQLESLIALPARDSRLAGMEAVGWWASHGRSSVALKSHDVELHDQFFSGARQVALIVKPVRQGPATAAFFGRDAAGLLPDGATANEFELRANVSALMRPPRDTSVPQAAGAHQRVTAHTPLAPPRPIGPRRQETARAQGRPHGAHESTAAVAERTEPVSVAPVGNLFSSYTEPKRGIRWGLFGAIALGAALAGAAALLIPRLMSNQPDTAGLRVEESGSLLLVRWDQTIPRLRFADGGVVEITDQGATQSIRLDREELTSGMLTYVRHGSDVTVALRVRSNGKVTLEEFARYLGPPVPARNAAAAPAAIGSQLTADEQRADEALRQEAVRKERLAESIRILENRLRHQ